MMIRAQAVHWILEQMQNEKLQLLSYVQKLYRSESKKKFFQQLTTLFLSFLIDKQVSPLKLDIYSCNFNVCLNVGYSWQYHLCRKAFKAIKEKSGNAKVWQNQLNPFSVNLQIMLFNLHSLE